MARGDEEGGPTNMHRHCCKHVMMFEYKFSGRLISKKAVLPSTDMAFIVRRKNIFTVNGQSNGEKCDCSACLR